MVRKRIDINRKLDDNLEFLGNQYLKVFGVKPPKVKLIEMAIDGFMEKGIRRKPRSKKIKW